MPQLLKQIFCAAHCRLWRECLLLWSLRRSRGFGCRRSSLPQKPARGAACRFRRRQWCRRSLGPLAERHAECFESSGCPKEVSAKMGSRNSRDAFAACCMLHPIRNQLLRQGQDFKARKAGARQEEKSRLTSFFYFRHA